MKNRINFVLVLAWISLIAVSASYFFLPDQIPMHWNIKGEVDAYGPKYFVFFMAILPVSMYYLMNILRKIDPKYKKIEEKKDAYNLMRDITVALFVAVSVIFIMHVAVSPPHSAVIVAVPGVPCFIVTVIFF